MDIYSPENIARSRARAAGIRATHAEGELSDDWLEVADQVDAYADEREAIAAERRMTTSTPGSRPLPEQG